MKTLALSFTCALLVPGMQAQQAPVSQAPAIHGDRKPSQPSTALSVRFGTKTVTLALADLAAMPQVTVSVHNEHTKADETYAGPLVSDVLARAGLALSETTQHGVLDSYVSATGTDSYFVVFSGAELQSGLHKAQVIVAITQAGQPLTRTGAFQLIDTIDVKPARWVRNLSSLTVVPVSGSTQ